MTPSTLQPTGLEQEFLERLNDARANPAAYGQSIGVNLSGVAPSQPLAMNLNLVSSSYTHSLDMSNNNYFGHTGSDGSSPGQRMTAAGYAWSGWAESIAGGYNSVESALAALITDTGVPDLGHRDQLLSTGGAVYAAEQETGVGVVMNGSGNLHDYYTIDSAYTNNTQPFLTGVVYNDLNHNGLYDNGEGLGNVTITAKGNNGTYQMTTWGSGGYSLRVPSGTYTVTATGAGMGNGETYTVTVGTWNYRLNFLANQAPPAAPGGLTAKAVAADQIQLAWTADNGATGYLIQRSPDGVNWVQVSTATAASTVLTDGDLTPGTTYSYRIQAYNGAGNSGYSSVVSATTQAGNLNNLFADNFDNASVNAAWSFVGGSWSQSGGLMQQTSSGNSTPRKALVTGLGSVPDEMIIARVRVDSWTGGDGARAGVGLYTDPSTGQGYNLLFHNNTSTVQFLNDGVTWGNSYNFNWSVGTWYWFELEDQGGVLQGKIWADGAAVPTTWQFTQSGWNGRSSSGAPSLNGGTATSGGAGNATVSFDAVSVVNLDNVNVSPPAAAPGNFKATAASSHQINLSWSDVAGESGFAVERSSDGVNWTQIATTAAGTLSYSDMGLNGSTTWDYRVHAFNSGGNGPYSATASATTNAPLFSDALSSGSLSTAWKTVGGNWSASSGVLQQTSTANSDPRKALITNQTYPANVEIMAEVRVDSWTTGSYARAGVGLYTDPSTGQGYNLVFHNDTKTVQFLNDGVAWGNSYTFNWQVGTWYWFKLEMLNGVLLGKIWAAGTPEPTAWMFTQSGWTSRTSGAPSLNGGSASAGGTANSTVSFANVSVDTAY